MRQALSNFDWGNWLYGFFVSTISGGASAVYLAMVAGAVDPKNLPIGSSQSFKLIGLMFAWEFVKDAALYLKQNPVPRRITEATVVEEKPSGATTTTTIKETKMESDTGK